MSKILLVDDTRELNDACARIMRSASYEVYQAYDGKECLAFLETLTPDVVLLDVVMPGLNGIEICKLIKSNPLTSGIFVLLLSGLRTESDHQAEGLEAGADGYIARPVQNREFLARVEAAIRIVNTEKELKAALALSKKLEAEQYKLTEIIRKSLNEIYILNPELMQFEFVNEGALRNLGYKNEEIKFTKPEKINLFFEELNFNELIIPLLKGEKENLVFKAVNKRKNQSEYPVEVYLQMHKQHDKPVFFVLMNDISIQMNAEKLLKENENRLKELNATKDKFFTIIAHDLKSPFNSILGFSSLLNEEIKEKNYRNLEKYAGIIEESSQRAMDLLLNLLEWARSQTGKMDFNPTVNDFIELINDTTLLLNESAANKSIHLIKDMPATLSVKLDKAMISTVLRNLISNAIKFTRTNGEILIKAEVETNKIIFSVSDNGLGIPEEDIDKLFRIEESITTKGTFNEAGTGLGLILCKEFIEKHGVCISVESEFGKGSTFSFELPL